MLLVIVGAVVWLVVIPAAVVSLAWAADIRRRYRVGLIADPLPVILLGDELRKAAPSCARRIAADRMARRRSCPAPAAPTSAR